MTLPTPLLDIIKNPRDLHRLPREALRPVADEPRAQAISGLAVTGGHFGADLGVAKIALHYVLDAHADRLIRHVGHPACPHKIRSGATASAACARVPARDMTTARWARHAPAARVGGTPTRTATGSGGIGAQ